MCFSPITDALVSMPVICELSEIELAHELMRKHRNCRAQDCAWKQLSYRTLVYFRRIEPPRSSPRERAHRHGAEFSSSGGDYGAHPKDVVPVETFQQVLAGLNELANGLYPNDSRDG